LPPLRLGRTRFFDLAERRRAAEVADEHGDRQRGDGEQILAAGQNG